jgi:ankyrin repeat protein
LAADVKMHAGIERDFGRFDSEIVRALLEHGANVDAEDDKGRTPFQIASARRVDKTTKLLSEHGAKARGVL